MTDLAYAGLNTTLRLLELQLLTQTDYDTMLQMNNSNDVLNYLSKTAYVVPEETKQTKDFEPVVQQRLEEIYNELIASSPDRRVIEIFSLRYTYHNLKLLIKEAYMGIDCEHLIIPIGTYSVEQLRHMVELKGEVNDLHPVLKHSISDAITAVEDMEDFLAIEVIMDTAYLRHIRQNAEDLKHDEVLHFTKMRIDFENLTTFIRAYTQGRSNTFIYSTLSSQGAINRDEIIENWRAQDLNALSETYNQANYFVNLDDVWTQLHTKKVDPMRISASLHREFAGLLRQYSLEPFGPMPVLTYLYFLENETDNVRLLLIGKENNIQSDLIRERMRPIYGI